MNAAPRVYSAAERVRSGGRDDVRAGLLAVRDRTLALSDAYAKALGPAMAVRYDPGLNPPRWELGHVAWFQEWWVARNPQRALGDRADPDARRPPPTLACADGWFDSSRIAHPARWELPLPDRAAVHEWLASTLATTLVLLDALPAQAGADDLYFFRLACLHETMHAEAACYMARTIGFELPHPVPDKPVSDEGELHVPATRWRLGADGPGFAFDNEVPARDVGLPAFDIDAAPVSWDRFQGFVADSGYADARWWTDEGWAWAQRVRGTSPSFPTGRGAATHLSWHEAQAWCRWAGRRLPHEAEWECAAMTQPGFEWGHAWEWTASAFQPFPGFRAHPYRDYSQPWFGTRRVLRGACPATSPELAHPRYRNFFEPHRIDVFSGFRSCAGGAR